MKNVAIVVTTVMRRQGITSVVLNLLRQMPREAFSVTLLTALPAEDWFCREIRSMGITFVRLEAGRIRNCIGYIVQLQRFLRQNRVDVLHVHGNSATMWLEIYAAKRAGVPLRIAHSHTSSCLSKTVHGLLRPLLIRDMTLGLACSELSQEFAFGGRKSVVLRNGIDTEAFRYRETVRADYRKRFSAEDLFVIGHVGNLVPVKNHLFLCAIARELKSRELSGFRFYLAGEGVLREEIEAYLRKHNLTEEVVLLGSRSDTANLYQMFDVLVLPSLYEGFPMVLVEAQTAGLKCLISDTVTKTADLLGTARFLPIDAENAAGKWADALESAMRTGNHDRTNAKARVNALGYSSARSAAQLVRIYSGELTFAEKIV